MGKGVSIMPKQKVDEWAYFRNDKGKLQYNKKCLNCIHTCKQSIRADIVVCKDYKDRNRAKV